MDLELGVNANVAGVATTTTRINTKSALDFVVWAQSFIAPGVPSDYDTEGPERDGAAIVSWSAAQVGVKVSNTLAGLTGALTGPLPVDVALRKRGALLVSLYAEDVAVCCGLNDILTVIHGRFFLQRLSTAVEKEAWGAGYLVPGLDY